MSGDLFRIYFHGRYYVDTATANNNNVDSIIDINAVNLTDYWSAGDDKGIVERMKTLGATADAPPAWPADAEPQIPGYWDYYGTNGVWFDGVVVTGGEILDAEGGSSAPGADPLIGMPVSLTGERGSMAKIVDLDPTGVVSSQIFSGEITIGDKPGCYLSGTRPSVAHSRWLNIFRNLHAPDVPCAATALFQSAVEADNLRIDLGKQGSALLAAVAAAKEQGYGIAFQYSLYYTEPSALDPAALAAAFARGEQPHNPKHGYVTGYFFPYKPGELKSLPPGRLLQTTLNLNNAGPPIPSGGSAAWPLGPLLVQTDEARGVLALNLLNTIPEIGPELTKVNLGDLTLGYLDDQGQMQSLATLPYKSYGRDAYRLHGGLLEVKVSQEQLAAIGGRPLCLTLGRTQLPMGGVQFDFGTGAQPALLESEYVVATDDRNRYLDSPYAGELAPGMALPSSDALRVRVTRFGRPAAGVTVSAVQWRSDAPDPGMPSNPPAVPERPGVAPSQSYQGPVLSLTPAAVTDGFGQAELEMAAATAGVACVCFTAAGAPQAIDPNAATLMNLFFANVRVLPDDYSLLDRPDGWPAEKFYPDWASVYQAVMRYYFVLYPGMNQLFDMNDELAMKAFAAGVAARTDMTVTPFDSALFMPVTREMSAGKRALLNRWLLSVRGDLPVREELRTLASAEPQTRGCPFHKRRIRMR